MIAMMSWQEWRNPFLFFFLSFLWRKHLSSLFSVYYNVVQLRYVWWNYFLNNLSVFVDVTWLLHHDHQSAECGYIFWWHISFINSFCIASYGAPINYFIWTYSSLFLHAFLLINSNSFCFHPYIFCHLLAS